MEVVQSLVRQIEGIMVWARGQDKNDQIFQHVAMNLEANSVEIMATLEAIAKILVTTNITSKEEIATLRQEYLDAHEAYREAQKSQIVTAEEPKSVIWTPPTN
jgi:hypothetical protein